jgi:hypothetical protein
MAMPEIVEPPKIEDLLDTARPLKFNGYLINLVSAPEDPGLMDITGAISDLQSFHGDTKIHDLVFFGGAMNELKGSYRDRSGLLKDKVSSPENGVIILSEHIDEAQDLVVQVDRLAERLAAEGAYDDKGLAREYYDAAKAGYDMLAKNLPSFGEKGQVRGLPLSLERAGLVTTRLAAGVGPNAEMKDEIKVVTKRAHPAENPADLMVSVRWRNLDDIQRLRGVVLDIADFVNPASWASSAAALLSASCRGGEPNAIVHRSFMATGQGIDFSRRILTERGITPYYYAVGASYNLTDNFYLANPAVGDAGHILRHHLPEWYEEPETCELPKI